MQKREGSTEQTRQQTSLRKDLDLRSRSAILLFIYDTVLIRVLINDWAEDGRTKRSRACRRHDSPLANDERKRERERERESGRRREERDAAKQM